MRSLVIALISLMPSGADFYLRTNKEACDAYAIVKKSFAEKYPYDIDGYCDGKDEFVKLLEQKARLEKAVDTHSSQREKIKEMERER